MRLGRGRHEAPEISLTALIDVVFLLLIFFMVSTTFERASQLSIELPEAQVRDRPEERRPLEVSVDARGRFYVDGRVLVNTQPGTLRRALREASAGRESPALVISADQSAQYQAVITVMDVARELGLVRIRLATRLSGGQ